MHDESIGINPGRCRGEEDAKALLDAAKDLGCNFLRLAHYPHSEQMVRLAEEMGFMLWEEIPCYWNIDWSSEETYANAENQLLEMIGAKDLIGEFKNKWGWTREKWIPSGTPEVRWSSVLISIS